VTVIYYRNYLMW